MRRLSAIGWTGVLLACGCAGRTRGSLDDLPLDDPSAMKVDHSLPSAPVVILPDAEVMRPPAARETTDWAPSAEGTDRKSRVERLLRRHGVAPSAQIPADKRLDWDKPVVLRPADPSAAWREYRKAWLQDDAEAGYALLTESSRERIREQLAEWARRADQIGLEPLLGRLTDSGFAHHVRSLRASGDVRGYGVRQFFEAAWSAEHADVRRVRETVNCWDTGWTPEGPTTARVSGRVVAPVLGSVREVEVRAVRETFDGAWHVEMEIR